MDRNRNRIRLALAPRAAKAQIAEEQQRDATELANARRDHEASVRATRTGRSTTRQRWGRPPGGND